MVTNRPGNPGNPYSNAVGSYASSSGRSGADTPRDIEAKALLKAARMIQELHDTWNDRDLNRIEKTVVYNRQIWSVFYESALQDAAIEKSVPAHENSQAQQKTKIRNNIVSLASFVFQRSLDIMAEPSREKLPVLITINREIAAGLMQKPEQF